MHWHGPSYIYNQGFIHTLYTRFQPKTHNKTPLLICWIITNLLFSIRSKVFLLMPTIPKLYQPPRFIIAHTKFVTPHTHICNQLIIYKSCRDHANFHANPSFVIQESYHVYLILHYILITHHAFIPNQNRPFKDKQIFNHSTVSPSTSLRLRDLAQAR